MLASILASGLAAGAIYALVGVTYNTMFSTSRVMSFTAGQLAMLGGVFGSMFMLKLGLPIIVGFLLTLLAGKPLVQAHACLGGALGLIGSLALAQGLRRLQGYSPRSFTGGTLLLAGGAPGFKPLAPTCVCCQDGNKPSRGHNALSDRTRA